MIPLPGVPTLFLDVKTAEDVTDSNEPRPPQDFRGFRLHRVIYLGAGPPAGQVAFHHLQGKTLSHWAPTQRQVITPELEETPQLTVALSAADNNHWNIGNDPIFPSCLATSSEQGMRLLRPLEQPSQLGDTVVIEKVVLLRDLDSAAQTSTTLPSKNAAIEVALHKY